MLKDVVLVINTLGFGLDADSRGDHALTVSIVDPGREENRAHSSLTIVVV
jgi:hypothetical protein